MPRGDRTGPAGYGPMTGRGAGYCAGYGVPGYANAYGGRGGSFGRGWGYGRGFGRRYGIPPTPVAYPSQPSAPGYGAYPAPAMTSEDQLTALRREAEDLKSAMSGIQKQIEDLEQQKES